jgi:hypothetical protein
MRYIQSPHLKPYLSVLAIVLTMFVMVFFKMETRRLGYTALKMNQDFQKVQDELRLEKISYAKNVRPERVRTYAVNKLTLNDPRRGQIIQMAGQDVVLAYE